MKVTRIVVVALLGAAATAAQIGAAAPAHAECVFTPASFNLRCFDGPAPPPLAPEQRPYNPETNPQGHPWQWWNSSGGYHWCPPECNLSG